jgi:outer membrane lipoprotein carrier protein
MVEAFNEHNSIPMEYNRTMKQRSVPLITAFVVLVALSANAARVTGPEILKKVQKTYKRVSTFSADFDHDINLPMIGMHEKMSGSFTMKKPHSFRVESPTQTSVTDGKTIWNYTPATKQVIINKYSPESMPMQPDNFMFDFAKKDKVTYLGDSTLADGTKCHVVNVAPGDKSLGITTMRVWIEPRVWLTRKVLTANADGGTSIYTLRNIKLNKRLPKNIFTYTPPEDAEVLDFRNGIPGMGGGSGDLMKQMGE